MAGFVLTTPHIDVLQHWKTEKRHGGNQILNRIDSMKWAVQNHWNEIKFRINIFLSENGRKKFVKIYS